MSLRHPHFIRHDGKTFSVKGKKSTTFNNIKNLKIKNQKKEINRKRRSDKKIFRMYKNCTEILNW